MNLNARFVLIAAVIFVNLIVCIVLRKKIDIYSETPSNEKTSASNKNFNISTKRLQHFNKQNDGQDKQQFGHENIPFETFRQLLLIWNYKCKISIMPQFLSFLIHSFRLRNSKFRPVFTNAVEYVKPSELEEGYFAVLSATHYTGTFSQSWLPFLAFLKIIFIWK